MVMAADRNNSSRRITGANNRTVRVQEEAE